MTQIMQLTGETDWKCCSWLVSLRANVIFMFHKNKIRTTKTFIPLFFRWHQKACCFMWFDFMSWADERKKLGEQISKKRSLYEDPKKSHWILSDLCLMLRRMSPFFIYLIYLFSLTKALESNPLNHFVFSVWILK